MIIYEYTDDSWFERDSGLYFKTFNAVDWVQNGSASNEHELYSQVLLHYTYYDEEEEDCEDVFYMQNPYLHFTLQELDDVLTRLGIVVKEKRDE